jgi:hypothetical protein
MRFVHEDAIARSPNPFQAMVEGEQRAKPRATDMPAKAVQQLVAARVAARIRQCAPSQDPAEFDALRARLCAPRSEFDSMTVASISSKDTIPIGTDTDPEIYNNIWASNLVRDPKAKALVRVNKLFRVLDAENIGFSYGEFLGRKGFFDADGVLKAIHYFQAHGLLVVVVTKRPALKARLQKLNVEVVTACKTDDVVLFKEAHNRNCPIVSCDNFKEHAQDIRISPELRAFLVLAFDLQVRFCWSHTGQFMPDFDLEPATLRPGASAQAHVMCTWCRKEVLRSEGFPHAWDRKPCFSCQSCFVAWKSQW